MKKLNAKLIVSGISAAAAAVALSLTAVSAQAANVVYGDANLDGEVSVADAAAILQFLGNNEVFPLESAGKLNADVFNRGDGITPKDALSIQKYAAKLIDKLPESVKDGYVEPGVDDPISSETYITLKGSSAEIKGDYAVAEGSKVTISHSGTFYIEGTLDDGQIEVNVPDETADPETVKLFFNGVNITGKSAPAILITNAENTSINLADGTENFISDGDTAYAGGGAVIEAKDDLTIKGGEIGDGKLVLTANTQNGIACNNDIKINGGVIDITTLNATDKTNGINGKTSLTVKSGTLTVDAEGDGIKSSKGDVKIQGGTVMVKAGNDAVQAETTIDVTDGVLVAGGDRGLTAVTGVNITGGVVIATATDNQADPALLGGTTQGTILFNCIDCVDSKDGTWKKANTFGSNYGFMKKYKYVLISDPSFTAGSTKTFRNQDNGSAVMHSNNDHEFKLSAVVTAFENVNPSGAVPPAAPDPEPPATPTDGNYTITLSGASIASNAPDSAASVNGSVLTVSEPGVFAVSGEAKEVQIVVDVDKTKYPDGVVELDLVGANISNSTTAPVYVANIGDEVQIVAKKDTLNVISDGTVHNQTYTDSDGNTSAVEGAVFARDDIKFKGTGSLTINGNTDDAVVCKNDIKIYNGNITINAKDDGIRGKDSVTIGNASDTDFTTLKLTVNTEGGDGIKSTATDSGNGIVTINGGTVDIKAYADGIQGEQDVVINGGDITVYTYDGSGYTGSGSGAVTQPGGWGGWGGMGMDGNSNKPENSAKGIKAVGIYDAAGTTWQSGGNIAVNGGKITIDSSDDAIHCGGAMTITGGEMKISTADDALHSDHDLTIGTNGGSASDLMIYVPKCYEGVEGENIYQYNGTVLVKSDDDGYNAAGGADGSGNANPGGFFPGGMGGGGNNTLSISGGIAIVQSASGDHDAFDSNGSLTVTGGVVFANGNEPLDSDGTNSATGGTVLTAAQSGNIAAGTMLTITDESGNVLVSFKTMQAMGTPAKKYAGNISVYTGGAVSGGTDLITLDDSQTLYASGTITGGTAVTLGTASSGGNTRPR